MTNDVDIKLIGDEELAQALRNLNYATQQRTLKGIIRDAGNKTIVKALRRVSPVRTGKLRKSMGVVTGKSKKTATVFVGPRMSHRKTRSGQEGYSGWVANILEYAKNKPRTPLKSKAFRPFTGTAAGPQFYKKVGPISKRTNFTFAITSNLRAAEVHIEKSTRTVIERAWKRKRKMYFGEGDYGAMKGR